MQTPCFCACHALGLLLQGGAGGQFNTLMRLHNRQNVSDRAMQQASREISSTCDRLRVADAVRNSALEIYKDVSGRRAADSKGWGVAAVHTQIAGGQQQCRAAGFIGWCTKKYFG